MVLYILKFRFFYKRWGTGR